jgi:microcystin degradation protein MlrC
MGHNALRIAVGGISQETNTFSPLRTDYDDFVFLRGDEICAEGLGRRWQDGDVGLLPTIIARACPGGPVGRSAYVKIRDELLRGLEQIVPVDGVYLELHGAMEIEGIEGGEEDLARAVRSVIGKQPLVAASLDLHGTISPGLVKNVDILTAYRTAPHRDREETRERALALLIRSLAEGLRPTPVMVKLPLLLTGEQAITDLEPARGLYARLPEIVHTPGIMDASLLIGFAWSDRAYTSVSVIVVAESSPDLAHGQAVQLASRVWELRQSFRWGVEVASVEDAIQRALASVDQPVFISDSGDNVTAGGAGDSPLFAKRFLEMGLEDVLVAGLTDAEAVRKCFAAGKGADVKLSIGGKVDRANAEPLRVDAHVEHLLLARNPLLLSRNAEPLGESPGDREKGEAIALVRSEGVRILLTTHRHLFADRASIAEAGVDSMQQGIVVVKQGYLFPDLYDLAPRAIMALSPGSANQQINELHYENLARPIYPLDADVSWESSPEDNRVF